jgi:hypothetical protein
MKRLLAAALLALGLSFAGQGTAEAASMSIPGTTSQALPNAVGDSAIEVRRGWWAVPVIVGGVILYHQLERHHYSCYRRCRRWNGPRYCRRYC